MVNELRMVRIIKWKPIKYLTYILGGTFFALKCESVKEEEKIIYYEINPSVSIVLVKEP